MEVPVIAIDGPAASGKGTVAAAVAQVLHFHWLDSGALYRLVALKSLWLNLALESEQALADAAAALDARFSEGRVWLEQRDVGEDIRDEAVGVRASQVAALPGVRAALLARQRAFRQPPGLVADGRDMGTVVFPDAALKVYITASAEERASRRHKQLIEKGISVNIDSLLRAIRERDERDAGRTVAPLKPAPGAHILNTTQMTIEAAVMQVLSWYKASSAAASTPL